jgi:hypothetical protein
VPQQFLDGSDIRTSLKKMGRKTVAQHMGTHRPEAGPASYLPYDVAECASG